MKVSSFTQNGRNSRSVCHRVVWQDSFSRFHRNVTKFPDVRMKLDYSLWKLRRNVFGSKSRWTFLFPVLRGWCLQLLSTTPAPLCQTLRKSLRSTSLDPRRSHVCTFANVANMVFGGAIASHVLLVTDSYLSKKLMELAIQFPLLHDLFHDMVAKVTLYTVRCEGRVWHDFSEQRTVTCEKQRFQFHFVLPLLCC